MLPIPTSGCCMFTDCLCTLHPQVLSDERSRKRYDYALAHPEEDIQVQ